MKIALKKIQFPIGRQTKIKKAIINILSENSCLLHKNELIKNLKNQKIIPNRSTIYRELKTLEKNNIIKRSIILGNDYYEISKDHHHHIICLKCNKISKVVMNNHLENQEKQITKKTKFDIIKHSLEFYGYCSACK